MSLREGKKLYKIIACNDRKKARKKRDRLLQHKLKTSDSVVFNLSGALHNV